MISPCVDRLECPNCVNNNLSWGMYALDFVKADEKDPFLTYHRCDRCKRNYRVEIKEI